MAMAVAVQRRRFTADEYQQMGRAGILREDDRVELIDGEVIAKMGGGPRHAAVVSRLLHHFVTCADESAIVRAQDAVRLNLFNQPEPDIALLRPRGDFYASAHPGPADILLVVEVAESSIGYDRTVKAELYARLGVAEYWLVDLNVDVVTRYTDPADGQYRRVEPVPAGVMFAPQQLPACRLTTADIFG
jgi:Uma2 family endonuclease